MMIVAMPSEGGERSLAYLREWEEVVGSVRAEPSRSADSVTLELISFAFVYH